MNNLKKSDTWKIQLTIANNFISSKDTHEKSVIKSDNIKFLNYDNGDEVGEQFSESFFNEHQIEFGNINEKQWLCLC